jgi:hypothetical protein
MEHRPLSRKENKMFEPKQNSVKKSTKIVEPPVIPQMGGWTKAPGKTEFDVKKPGFEK